MLGMIPTAAVQSQRVAVVQAVPPKWSQRRTTACASASVRSANHQELFRRNMCWTAVRLRRGVNAMSSAVIL